MANIKFENLDDSPINFDLSDEDLQSIKGGSQFKFDTFEVLQPIDIEILIEKLKDITIKIECYCPDEHWWKSPPLIEDLQLGDKIEM